MPPKRRQLQQPSLTQRLEKWRLDPQGNPEMLALADEAFKNAGTSYKFDASSPSTQNALHLREFELFMEGVAKSNNETCDHEYLWGDANIEKNLRTYLCFAASIVTPRSYLSTSIKFQTLVQRRQSMVHWITRNCSETIKRGKLWTASQEALHFAFRQHNMPTDPLVKHYLTKYDLVALIEHDASITTNPDVAEQHHLSWVLGFICGVRPGTIATARKREDQYLQWKDIVIKRSGEIGSNNFRATITFRWLKGYRDEIRRSLTFNCAGPVTTADVMYSIPHRLLAIMLRRGILRDHQTFDGLLAGTEVTIAIKDAALDDPVICASNPKGDGLDLKKAARCDAISAYMQRRALDFGLPPGITFYAWRRSAGTNVGDVLGADKARQFLGHEAQSHTFETSYNQGLIAFDAMSIAMGRKPLTAAELLEDESLTVNRIKETTENKQKWIEHYVNSNEEYQKLLVSSNELQVIAAEDPDDESKQDDAAEAQKSIHSMRRSLRTQGRLAFQTVEGEITSDKLTQEELAERRAEALKPGAIQTMLLDAAKAAQTKVAAGDTVDNDDDQESYNLEDLRDVRDNPDNDEEIAVDNLTTQAGGDTAGAEDTVTAIAAAARMLMEVLTGAVPFVVETKTCPLCEADETVSPDKKAQVYLPGKLNQHLSTGFHSAHSKFLRKHKKKALCPFGCGKKFAGKDLIFHVHDSVKQTDEHLLAAARAGLFARDFGTREGRQARTRTRVVGGQLETSQIGDADAVPMAAVLPPGNIDAYGSVAARKPFYDKKLPVLRLPTIAPITETNWWKEHPTGVHGHVADTLQAQHRFMANILDQNLRALGHGQADESGKTRERAFESERRRKNRAILRKRLAEKLNWAWAEDVDNVVQPEEEDDDADDGSGHDGEVRQAAADAEAA